MIEVLWYTSESKLGRLIRLVTKSEYSHVAVVVRGSLYEALGSGIVGLEGEQATRRRAQAAALRRVEVGEDDAIQARWFLENHVARRYSFAGFIAAGLGTLTRWRVVIALDGTYICSGLAATALVIAGVRLVGEARLQTPESLAAQLAPLPFED